MATSTRKNKRIKPKICDNEKMTFEDCELAIMRLAVEEIEEEQKIQEKTRMNEELKTIFNLLEQFLRKKKLVLYGGFALNALLPKEFQFYDEKKDVPDYDIYSPDSLNDAIELADFFYKNGYEEVETKSAMKYGTYKVYVNFIPVADITFLEKEIFTNIQKNAIHINEILFSPINFLRMNLYLELSRPLGDVTRWEKVLKRLTLLNRVYPLSQFIHSTVHHSTNGNVPVTTSINIPSIKEEKEENKKIHRIVKDAILFIGGVFFGGYAIHLYSQYDTPIGDGDDDDDISSVEYLYKPEFDVLHEDPKKAATIVKEKLIENGYTNISVIYRRALGEIIPTHYEIHVNGKRVAFIFAPIACHSYNTIKLNGKTINVATIDTMLSFYFAFYYVNQPHYQKDRILLMVQFLIEIEHKNRLEQKGLLQRFSMTCIGKQKTIVDIRSEKIQKFKELRNQYGMKEYYKWFLKYTPSNQKQANRIKQVLRRHSPRFHPQKHTRYIRRPKSKRMRFFQEKKQPSKNVFQF